jgi:hypothetical protein
VYTGGDEAESKVKNSKKKRGLYPNDAHGNGKKFEEGVWGVTNSVTSSL